MKNYSDISNMMDFPDDVSIFTNSKYPVMIIKDNRTILINKKEIERMLEESNCKVALYMSVCSGNYEVDCISNTKEIRSLEFLEFVFDRFGLTSGNEMTSHGKISTVILSVYMSDMENSNEYDFFFDRANKYFEDTDIINSKADTIDSSLMKRYYKKNVKWAFVKTTDIIEAGKILRVKSLENPSGIKVKSCTDSYIMIGYRGEVYDITRDKFEKSYECTEEVVDIFESMMDIMPTVQVEESSEYVPIDEIAHICYPKRGSEIYAKELLRRTKVFIENTDNDYFVGKPGDYLAIRSDDLSDKYIIQKDIFTSTYSEC